MDHNMHITPFPWIHGSPWKPVTLPNLLEGRANLACQLVLIYCQCTFLFFISLAQHHQRIGEGLDAFGCVQVPVYLT